nr:MAG: putative RNA-dependent RNA polymerase [Mitoviridae sp.]
MLNLLTRLLTMTRQSKIRGAARLTRRLAINSQQRLIGICVSIVRLAVGGMTRDRLKAIYSFSKVVILLQRTQGQKGLVLWLKACHVALMKGIPGSSPMKDSRPLGAFVSLSRGGLPRVIPKLHRLAIKRGDASLIRLWLSLFGLYRVLKYPAPIRTDTITRPGVTLSVAFLSSWETWLKDHFFRRLEEVTDENYKGMDPKLLPAPELLDIAQAGAASAPKMSSFSSRAWAAYVWVTGFMHVPGAKHMHCKVPRNWGESLPWYLYAVGQYEGTKSLWTVMENEARYDPQGSPFAGRLATKLEAAGKVRVFAMVDYWTQVALKPLHDTIFDLLKGIPQDGTFDQHKPVKALIKRSKSGYLASFDLSAATDRLPVRVQQSVLAVMFNPAFAEAWKNLLVDREYSILPPVRDRPDDPIHLYDESDHYRYAVGQPMGAYSSWAMLALTHHVIVQFAAYRAGVKGWFKDYAVLGDDVIIGNEDVANHYLRVMEILGVEVGLQKSLISNNKSGEFAKRLYFKGQDVSGLPWNLWLMSQQSLSAAVAMCQWLKQGWTPWLSQTMAAFGVGMKNLARLGSTWETLPKRLQALLVILTHSDSVTAYSKSNWLEWVGCRGPQLPQIWGNEASTWVTPWLDSLVELTNQCEEVYDRRVKDVFFSEYTSNTSPVIQAILSRTNAELVVLERRIQVVRDTITHLNRLGISLQARQISNLMYQEIRKLENSVARLPLPIAELSLARTKEVEPRFTDLYRLWLRIRKRGSATFGLGIPEGIPRIRPSAAPEFVLPLEPTAGGQGDPHGSEGVPL